jgi:hypothetical protein
MTSAKLLTGATDLATKTSAQLFRGSESRRRRLVLPQPHRRGRARTRTNTPTPKCSSCKLARRPSPSTARR